MLGLGEAAAEIEETLRDLRQAGVSMVTMGQYLRPSGWHLPVAEFVTPETFQNWEKRALEMGFIAAPSGPLVRSSYKAGEAFLEGMLRKKRKQATAIA